MNHKEAVKQVLEAIESLSYGNQAQKQFFEGIFEFMGECGGPQYREALTEFEEYKEISQKNEELEGTIEDLRDELKTLQEETKEKIDDLDSEIDRLRRVVKDNEDEIFELQRKAKQY